ncbi:uncharacterized protein LOC131597508 [Vicia villosa]|uniref:uncharacterized protein LOC131597508 n=1 Tax=Vicia villosa TaxID=3911 RepID=UPI00273AFB03|nr:uncharacterized protein LOC131597508 [Vicia villosa]
MGTRGKRGRGRPKLAPSSPAPQPSQASSTVKETPVLEENEPVILVESLQQSYEAQDLTNMKTLNSEKEHNLKETTQPEQKLWVDIVSENRNPSKGLSIQYVAPNLVDGEVEVAIEEDDVASEIHFWANSLILYAFGEDLSMNMVKNYMAKTWNFVKLPNLYYNDDGYFILRFHSHDDMDAVLMKGPYTLRNVPLLLQEWRPDFNLKRDMLRTLPIWVKLPQLPMCLWGEKILSKIGIAIGFPLVMDECTASKLRVSYARILVEVDVTKDFVKEIPIRDCEGRKIKKMVEYEWRPKLCDKCKKLGHQCKEPVRKVERKWQPKPLILVNVTTNEHTKSTPIAKNVTVEQGTNSSKDSHEMDKNVDETPWTLVKSTREKGKKISTDAPDVINCLNGFDALGITNDSLVTVEAPINKNVWIRHCKYIDNYNKHANGRVWISWNAAKYDIQKIQSTDQAIHCGVYDHQGKFKYYLTAVYAHNTLAQRKILWQTIVSIHSTVQGPWCIIGDFNNVMSSQGWIGGRMVKEAEYGDLHEMMKPTDLCEMDSSGDHFTWNNRQIVGTVYSRIDRVLGNMDGFHDSMDIKLKFSPLSVSDHALLYLEQKNYRHKASRFKFHNCITEMEGFKETVENSWREPITGTTMYILWNKL